MTENYYFNPKISIVIPVFNGSNYMQEAIDSALSQTYQNIEVLVINDGSCDEGKTEKIALSYENKIRYFCKENCGVASALNLGIKKMSGDYFSWLSHDDFFSENRIEEDVRLINNNENKITYSRHIIVDAKNTHIREDERILCKVTSPYDALLLAGVGFCTMTVKKSCFEKVGLFNNENRTMQDVEMVLRLSKFYPFIYNPNAITYSREHSNRGTYTQNKLHKIDSIKLCEFIKSNFTIDSFFNIERNENKNKTAWAHLKLGSIYRSFGSYKYADENYRLAYLNDNRKFSEPFFYYTIGSKILDSFPFIIMHKLFLLVNTLIIRFKK